MDIRFGLLKRLSRAFFEDLGVPIPEEHLIPLALEFLLVIRDGNQRLTPEVREVIKRHPRLMEVLDDLHRNGIISYQMVKAHTGTTKRRRK